MSRQPTINAERSSPGLAAIERDTVVANIENTIRTLHPDDGDVYEIRAFDVPDGNRTCTWAGYFNDPARAALKVYELEVTRKPQTIGILLNAPNPALLARAENRFKKGLSPATSDKEIVRRRWLFVDCDAGQPSGVSASDDESRWARILAEDCEQALAGRGWPSPLWAMSGNGYALLYRIDLPNDDETNLLIKNVLGGIPEAIGVKTANGEHVDLQVFNAARFCRLFGTMNRKGDNLKDRPHRRSELYVTNDRIEVVSVDKLSEIASLTPRPKTHNASKNGKPHSAQRPRLNVAAWLGARHVEYNTKPGDNGSTIYRLAQCPFNEQHRNGKAAIIQQASGATSASCKHDSCNGRGWCDFRDAIGGAEDYFDPPLRHGPPRAKTGTSVATPKQSNNADAQGADEQANDDRPTFTPISSRDLDDADYRVKWLARRLLVAGQPGIIGGRAKSLKTSIAVDLAISLGTGTPFLGRFETVRTKTIMLSGESGEFTTQETARRIAASHGVRLADVDVLWDFRLPQVAIPAEMAALTDLLIATKAEVLIIDPAYLCLLAGDTRGIQAGNVLQMGPLLLGLTEVGRYTNATIVLCHHFRKNPADKSEKWSPPELEELAMAGFAEWARQWLLLGRREQYDNGSGIHRLWLQTGGSVGHSGLWAVDVDEGQLGDDFTGRKWEVEISTATEAREERRAAEERRKTEQRQRSEDTFRLRLVNALRQFPDGVTCSVLTKTSGVSGSNFGPAILSLIQQGKVEAVEIKRRNGTFEGYRLTKK